MKTRRTQAARSQAAREHIVQAAVAVFALKGYGAASMDDICLAAGCSKGGLYHHFRTKSAVLAGVIDRLAALDALLPPFAVDGAAGSAVPASALARVLLDVWAEAARDSALAERLRAGYAATSASAGADNLVELVRIGELVQALTRRQEAGAAEAAARLGIERAA
jgi:AcrR family transcriptional regulator